MFVFSLQNLQAEQELDELNDSNSFLTLAINSAVKTLEHSEVDPDWFLQGEGHPLPEQVQISKTISVIFYFNFVEGVVLQRLVKIYKVFWCFDDRTNIDWQNSKRSKKLRGSPLVYELS